MRKAKEKSVIRNVLRSLKSNPYEDWFFYILYELKNRKNLFVKCYFYCYNCVFKFIRNFKISYLKKLFSSLIKII